MKGLVLVDTSLWVEVIRRGGDNEVREDVASLVKADRVRLCDTVRLELWNGTGSERDRSLLAELESKIPSVPTTTDVWDLARELAWQGRRNGVTLPLPDLLIVATAAVHRLELRHRDSHFPTIQALLANLHPPQP